MEQSEQEWIDAWRNGRIEGLERLVDAYRRPLFAFILRMTEGRDDAEEIFQETWFRVIQHRTSYRDRRFKSWLFRIARNLVIDRARKRKFVVEPSDHAEGTEPLEHRLPDPKPDPARQVGGRELGHQIRQEVARLPDAQREVYLLRMEAGLSFKEIAKLQQTSVNTALGRMHNAIGKLREALRGEYELRLRPPRETTP